MRLNADRFLRPHLGLRPGKKRSEGTRSQPRNGAVQRGFGGAAPNKQIEHTACGGMLNFVEWVPFRIACRYYPHPFDL